MQYVIGILFGILCGSAVALLVQDALSAVLSGVLTAGVVSWVASLNWNKARAFSKEVASKTSMPDVTALSIARSIGTAIWWPVWTLIVRIPRAIINDPDYRRAVAGLTLMLFLAWALLAEAVWILQRFSVVINMKEGGGILAVFVLAPACLSLLSVMASFVMFLRLFFTAFLRPKYSRGLEKDAYGWISHEGDRRGATSFLLRTIVIRTWNAVKIVAYPFIFIGWGFVALACKKTGAASLAAMLLTAAHLGFSAWNGWLAWTPNFALSLGITMMAGAWAGRRISYMVEGREPSLPRLTMSKYRTA